MPYPGGKHGPGHYVGGGGGPPVMGYSFGGASALLSIGQVITPPPVPPNTYAINAPPGTSAGDLLVTWIMIGPGYGGQSTISLRSNVAPFPFWSPTGSVSVQDTVIIPNRTVIAITPRIATGDVFDNVRQITTGGVPVAMQMALFTNAWPFGLATITADNEASEVGPDASMFREDAPGSGFNFLVDIFLTAKKATVGAAGAIVTGDVAEPSIILLSAVNYVTNAFGQGGVAAFGYRITNAGVPGIPTGNWGLSILEAVDSYAVSARWKSADS